MAITSPLLASTGVSMPAGIWSIDSSHSEVGFVVRHLVVSKVRGFFEKFTGTITVADDFSQSTVEATIDASSVNTRDEGRDNHLRTNDFFGTQEHPVWTFASTGVRVGSKRNYFVDGNLQIKGVTKPVTLALEVHGVTKDPYGNTKAGFTANTKINRSEFGIEFNAQLETGGFVLSDSIDIVIEIEATLQA
jgi:polyisoprenoid-binding protein YceI